MLVRQGIAAYFSGCFTLTLKPFENLEPHGKILLADVPKEVEEFIRARTKNDLVLISHDYKSPQIPKELVDFAQNYAQGKILPTSHYPDQPDKPYPQNLYVGNWNFRRAFSEAFLRVYQGASLVVTTRLHASLPCLALGTPVLMVNSEELLNDYRISSFLPYLNHTTYEDLLSGKYSFNFDEPKANPGGHEKFARRIRTIVTDFIASCENDTTTSPVDIETWLDGIKRSLRLKRIIKMIMPHPEWLKPDLFNF